ncbi:hypothetical protein HDU96_002005, partial [Phlyctochytrium bullatum]
LTPRHQPVTNTNHPNTPAQPTAANPTTEDRRGNRRRHQTRRNPGDPITKLSDKEWFKRLAHENLKILREARRAPFETDEDLYTAVFRARKQAFRDINDRAIERRRLQDRETRLSFQEQDFYSAPPTPTPSVVSVTVPNQPVDLSLPDVNPIHSVALSNPSSDPNDPDFIPVGDRLSNADLLVQLGFEPNGTNA